MGSQRQNAYCNTVLNKIENREALQAKVCEMDVLKAEIETLKVESNNLKVSFEKRLSQLEAVLHQ